MEITEEEKTADQKDIQSVSGSEAETIQSLLALPDRQILERILEHENPGQLVQDIPKEDFYWLVKRVGEEDCTPLLKMASNGQRQHLLDLESWQKDRLDIVKTTEWLGRLNLADPKGLAEWFFSEGEALAYYYLFSNVRVEIRDEDEDQDIEGNLFTLDGIYYVEILDKEHKETIEDILRSMARDDLDRYQAMLSMMAGVIPAELEEDMYRLRNVRLAEHGFLPPEEAVEIYAPLAREALTAEDRGEPEVKVDEEIRELIPISPLYYARGQNILTEAFSRINDLFSLDRIRLEFAGLCNQLLSADGLSANDLDVLIRTCQKAAGHLNLALERLCGTDISLAKKLIKKNPLVSIFRVGFGLVLELKWETERWLKNSWFYGLGLEFSFWGDEWGEILSGIMEDKPRRYTGFKETEAYQYFECLSQLDDCRKMVRRMKVLDTMLERLTKAHPLDRKTIENTQTTFYQLLFNLWARCLLNLEPCFSSISLDQAKAFFGHLRTGEEAPPYRMSGFKETFIKDFMAYASGIEPEIRTSLEDALSLVWKDFSEEYQGVSIRDLEGRFTKFISIEA